MSENPCTKTSAEFEKAITNITDPSHLQEAVRNYFEQNSAIPEPAPTPPAPVEAPQTHVRVIYPSGNNRFELYGASEADLDEKERQIRQLFGQR